MTVRLAIYVGFPGDSGRDAGLGTRSIDIWCSNGGVEHYPGQDASNLVLES